MRPLGILLGEKRMNFEQMKYYQDEVVLDEQESGKIENRMLRLREETGTEKAIHAILVTTRGLKHNAYSDVIQDVVTMSDLFEY